MIEDDTMCFPNNIVDVIAMRAQQLIDPDDVNVVKRPIDTMDPDETIGVIPVSWGPAGTAEMGRRSNQFEPVVQTYTVMIQALINDMDEDRAIRRHSLFSTRVRHMLYRDPVLLGALHKLRVEVDGVTESTTQCGVRSQQFLVNKADKSFQYLSVIEFFVETQTQ